MHIGRLLAASAAIGILAGCGGDPPPAAASPTGDPSASGAKASCGGPDHTDKGHCGGQNAAPSPSPSSSAAPAAK
jgi:hypothetical protein